MVNGIELTVAGALVTDDGRGIARIDSKARKSLNVISGDVIEIKGRHRLTAAIVWQPHQQDEGLDFVRIDGWIRQNIGVGIGDRVFLLKPEVNNAEKIILAPPPNQRNPMSPDFAQYAKMRLENKPLMKGDVVPVAMVGYAFNFIVVQVVPHGVVRVTKETEVVVKSEPVSQSVIGNDVVNFQNVGGLNSEIKRLREIIEIPIRHPELNEKLGIESKSGILIHGPSGTGKTLLASALANELTGQINVMQKSGPEFLSKFIGESEERLRMFFKEAFDKAPSLVIIDRIEAMVPNRPNDVENRLISQFAILFDEIHKKHKQVVVIGITNNLNSISPELLQSGRFEIKIGLGIPNLSARKEIISILFRNSPLAKDVKLDEIAQLTEGYTGADIKALIDEAGVIAIRKLTGDLVNKKSPPAELLVNLVISKIDIIEAAKIISKIPNKEEKHEDPLTEFDKAIKLDPNNAEIYHKKGEALLGQDRYEEAIKEFDKAIKLKPDFAVAYNNKGVSLSGLGSSEDAIKELDKAIKLDPKYARAYYNKGAVLYYHGKYEESIEMYDKVIKLDPNFAEVYDSKGNALQHLDKYEEAVKEFDKAIKINPNEPRYNNDKNIALKHLKKK